jgi:hypothetical protein
MIVVLDGTFEPGSLWKSSELMPYNHLMQKRQAIIIPLLGNLLCNRCAELPTHQAPRSVSTGLSFYQPVDLLHFATVAVAQCMQFGAGGRNRLCRNS